MSPINRNIFANFFGTALVAGLTIAITPAQVRLLGVEAYGIVGFITTLQLAFAALDLGLSSTLTRELAADHSEGKRESIALVRTGLSLYYAIAALVGLLLAALAGPIARNWFNTATLSPELLEHSLQIIALFLALRWPVALYTGIMGGLQRMDILNIVKAAAAIFRLAGGLIVLVIWRSLDSYLWWIAFSALVELFLFALACKGVYRLMPWTPGISIAVIQRVWRFSLSMNLLGITALIIVQMDRLIVSKQLSLVDLGYYNLAYTVATGLALIIGAISSAVMPSFAALQPDENPQVVIGQYIKADRLMLGLVGFASFVLMAYGDLILQLWIGNASEGAIVPLIFLAFGFWCNSIAAIAYNFAVAKGRPERFVKVNLAIIIPYAVLIHILVGQIGIEGAAISWVALNLIYIAVLVRPVHKKLVGISTKNWLMKAVVPVAAAGSLLFIGVRVAGQIGLQDPSQPTLIALMIASCILYGIFMLNFVGLKQLDFFKRRNLL
jgi:O-antigen/teichoic acid export membrane protein